MWQTPEIRGARYEAIMAVVHCTCVCDSATGAGSGHGD